MKIQKKLDVSNPEIWFNTSLELNSALVTVIGNKGSGKSALSDILGLVGNSLNFDNNVASFLNDTRFNRAPKYYGKDYETKENVWTHPGGCMSIVPIPGKEKEFLCVQEFYLKVTPSLAKIVWGKYDNGTWQFKDVVSVP